MYIVEERACWNSGPEYRYYGPFKDKESAEAHKHNEENAFAQLMASDCDRVTMQYDIFRLRGINGKRGGLT